MSHGNFFNFTIDGDAAEFLMDSNEVDGGKVGQRVHAANNVAQCFNATGSYSLTKVSLYVIDVGADNPLTVSIYDNNDQGTPTNYVDDTPGGQLNTTTGNGPDFYTWVDFIFSPPVQLTQGVRYWIVASDASAQPQAYRWQDSNGDAYADGYMADDGIPTWVVNNGLDVMFRLYGESSDDVGVERIIIPENLEIYEEGTIKATITNFGINDQGSFDVNIVIRNPQGMEVFNDTRNILSMNSSEQTNLSWTYRFLDEGDYSITVTTRLPTDVNSANDAKTMTMRSNSRPVLKLHEEITIDGSVSDWKGIGPAVENSYDTSFREYIWNDPLGDDNGDGNYVYPLTPGRFEGGCLDLLEFRVAVDSGHINFLLRFQSIDDGSNDGTDGTFGFSEQIIEILIDTDRDGTGREDTVRNARLALGPDVGWEYALWADGWGNGYLENEAGNIFKTVSARGSPVSNAVEISIPATGLLVPEFKVWRYVVLVGAQDDNSLPSPIEGSRSGFMKVDTSASAAGGGGGEDLNGADPNVYDIAFTDSQANELDDYGSSDSILVSHLDTISPDNALVDSAQHWAQSFLSPDSVLVSAVDIHAMDVGADSTTMSVSIQSNDDKGNGDPSDDEPSGIDITSVEVVDFTAAYETVNVPFSSPATLTEGEIYWVVAKNSDSGSKGYSWGKQAGDPYMEGAAARFTGGSWAQSADEDMIFAVYFRELTSVAAYQAIYFAPVVLNAMHVNGTQDEEWVSIYYNGTNLAPILAMSGWVLSDQDGNDFSFGTFTLTNKNIVTVFTGAGTNTSSERYWNRPTGVWEDGGDDVLLKSGPLVSVDFMNYTNGLVFGDPPPGGVKWGPEIDENLPKNPGSEHNLQLEINGQENDLFSDWGLSAIGLIEMKTFYLYDDGSGDISDPYDLMNTTPPVQLNVVDVDSDTNPGLTIRKSASPKPEESYQKFNLTPVLAGNFHIADDLVIDLWMDNNAGSALEMVTITLYDSDGSTDTVIANKTQTPTFDPFPGWELITIVIPDVDYVVPGGHTIVLNISAVGSLHNLWLAYNSTSTPSRIRIVPTRTFINVEWARTLDFMDVEKFDFAANEDITIWANVSDPLGSYDIAGAFITILSPTATTLVDYGTMNHNMTDPSVPSGWKHFEYTFNNTPENGIHTVIISGLESNGVIHNLTIFFNVIGGIPPQLLNPQVSPPSGDVQTYFNFTVDYLDVEGEAPTEIQVVINGLGTFNMSEVDPLDTNYMDGKAYYMNLTGFANGTDYSFYFRTRDGKGILNQTLNIPGPIVVNTPPVLTGYGHTPLEGSAVTDFNFTVTYTDLDNHPPDSILLNISGPSHSGSWVMMEVDPSDSDYTDGKDYYYNYTGFINGSYSHRFYANDTHGAFFESVGFPGPVVITTAPIFLLAGVTPVVGYISTLFNYTVTYVSLDNFAPTSILVNITGPSHSGSWALIEVDPSDTNYRNGKQYYYSYTGLIMGNNYSFHFAAITNSIWNESAEIFLPDVLNKPPVLSNYNLLPFVGVAGVTVFNYTVTYTDLDNQAPFDITVNITGPFSGNYTMFELDPLDLDYTDGKEYYLEIVLGLDGLYEFKFEANDTGGVWAAPISDIGPGIGGTAPILAQPKVKPFEGITTTWFNFTVTFADLQNDSAGTILLNLSGPSGMVIPMLELDTSDTNTSDGKIFYLNITDLQKGQYTFRVEGNDSAGNSQNSSFRVEPLVKNSPPVLSGSFISEGLIGGNWFNFSLVLSDLDNDTASGVYLNIIGLGNFTMDELDPGDLNTLDGKEYFINITLPKGLHRYRFEAADSGFNALWNHTGFQWINITNNIPTLTEEGVLPPSGLGWDFFNFTVNATDLDNDVLEVLLYILGYPGSPYIMNEVDPTDMDHSDGKYFYYNISLPKGTYTYFFRGDDGEDFILTLPDFKDVANNPPVIVTPDVTNILEDSFYNVDYNYTDLDLDATTWSLDTDASWLTIDAQGNLNGTPDNSHVGTYYVNVSLDDGDGGMDHSNFTLTVINTPPSLIGTPTVSVDENEPLLDNFDSSDDGPGNITYSLQTNATWLFLDPTFGILTGTPDTSQIGYYWVNITVSDGNGGSDSINYTVNVGNKPPVITTIPITLSFEDTLHIDDFNSDSDIPGVTQYYLNSNASWLSISNITGILSGTPDNRHIGWFWVNVTVDDKSGGTGFINYTLWVFNTPPSITTVPTASIIEDIQLITDFNCNDDGQGMITYHLDTNATWLGIDAQTGVLTGTPDNGDVGSYWVNVSVDDGNGGWDLLNYTLTVINLQPIIITSPVTSVLEDKIFQVDFDSIDDGDGNIQYRLKTNASWLSIDPATGLVNGSANNTQVGWYWVNVTVTDGNGGSDFRNFTLDVINTPPTIVTPPVLDAFEDIPFVQDFDSADDGQGDISFSLVTNAGWLMMVPDTGVIFGTPGTSDLGGFWVNVTAYDGNGGSASLNYTLTVQNTNDPPVITTVNVLFAQEDVEYAVDYSFFDLDDDSVTWDITSNATSWLDIHPQTGLLSGIPRNSDVGWYTVNISANDGNGGFAYTEFVLVVENTNDAPSVPVLVFPSDDSIIDTLTPTFTWEASIDIDQGDSIRDYTLQYSSSSSFSVNVTTVSGVPGTSYLVIADLMDESTYYWRVQAFDSFGTPSGFQSPVFAFDVDIGYEPPRYRENLKSRAIKWGDTWAENLNNVFELGSVTEDLVYLVNYGEITIDPETNIATWKPEKRSDVLTNVTFTVFDGVTNVTSHPIDLSVEKEVAPMSLWERILWPYPLLSLILVFIIGGVLLYRRIIYAPKVERVFLIHEHSILITHASVGKENDLDEDILSGMLAGVKNLISDAFGSQVDGGAQEDLHKLEFGDRNILLEKGNHFFIAVVFTGRANKDLISRIRGVIREIEDNYTEELKGWEGYTDAFEGIDLIIAKLLPSEKPLESEEVTEIEVPVPDMDEFYGEGVEVYDEDYGIDLDEPLELHADVKEEIVVKPKEEDLFVEEVLKEERKTDELDLVLSEVINEPIKEDVKATTLPLPGPLAHKDKEPSLTEEQKKSLPPPPWMRDKKAKVKEPEKPVIEEEIPAEPEEPIIEEEIPAEPEEPIIEEELPAEPERPIIEEELPAEPEEPEIMEETVEKPKFERVSGKKAAPPPTIDEILKKPVPEVDDSGIPASLAPAMKKDEMDKIKEDIVFEYECPSCGAGVSEEMKYCPTCGAEFIYDEEEVEEYECPSCGASVTPDMTKCPKCGVHFA